MDKVTATVRSRIMSAVRDRNTTPERVVRAALFTSGFRYRLHRRDLPGAPDIVLARYRVAVFVHGCFWHSHDCPRGRRPASNEAFWNAKLDRNRERDREASAALKRAGWTVVILWECSLSVGIPRLLARLARERQARLRRSTTELTR